MCHILVAASCVLFASPAFAQKVGDTIVVIAESETSSARLKTLGR